MFDSLMLFSIIRCAALLPWASANLMAASFSLGNVGSSLLSHFGRGSDRRGDNIMVWFTLSK